MTLCGAVSYQKLFDSTVAESICRCSNTSVHGSRNGGNVETTTAALGRSGREDGFHGRTSWLNDFAERPKPHFGMKDGEEYSAIERSQPLARPEIRKVAIARG